MKPPADLTQLFRENGLRITPQRQRIFRALDSNQLHPTAESIWAEVQQDMPAVSLKTVYETLRELVTLGEIQQLDLGTGASRFDPNISHHHHLVCRGCGMVTDFQADYSFLKVPPSETRGFVLSGAEVIFRGYCSSCAKRNLSFGG